MNQYVDNFFNYHLDNFARMAFERETMCMIAAAVVMNVVMYFLGRRDGRRKINK